MDLENSVETQRLIEWLKKDFDLFKEENREELKEIKADVKSLLQYKWQIMGATAISSGIIGILIQIGVSLFSKQPN